MTAHTPRAMPARCCWIAVQRRVSRRSAQDGLDGKGNDVTVHTILSCPIEEFQLMVLLPTLRVVRSQTAVVIHGLRRAGATTASPSSLHQHRSAAGASVEA